MLQNCANSPPPLGTVAFDPFLQAVLSTYGQLDYTNTSSIPTIGQAWRADGGEIVSMPGGGYGGFKYVRRHAWYYAGA
jgi:hypothetical protein